jgi:hypothetical protein
MNKLGQKFHTMVNRILREELDKTSAVGTKSPLRVPEMNGNGINADKKPKTFGSDANSKDLQTKESLLADLIKVTKGIGEDILVVWNDHDDLMVSARDLNYIRISPRWTDYYVIEMMTRNEDRIWVTGQSWEQVKEFVKTNLKDLAKQPTYTEKAYDKSYRSREDQTPSPDKGLPQKDKPSLKPLTNEPQKDTSKNKEKNYTEKQVKTDDDLPEKPMKEVKNFKKQSDYKVQEPVKLRKKKPDTKLTVKS